MKELLLNAMSSVFIDLTRNIKHNCLIWIYFFNMKKKRKNRFNPQRWVEFLGFYVVTFTIENNGNF